MEIMFINCWGQLVSTTKFCYYHKWAISLSEVKYNVTSNLITVTVKMSIYCINTNTYNNTQNRNSEVDHGNNYTLQYTLI